MLVYQIHCHLLILIVSVNITLDPVTELIRSDMFDVLVECISDSEPNNTTVSSPDGEEGELDTMNVLDDNGNYVYAVNVSGMLGEDFTITCSWTINDTNLNVTESLSGESLIEIIQWHFFEHAYSFQ